MYETPLVNELHFEDFPSIPLRELLPIEDFKVPFRPLKIFESSFPPLKVIPCIVISLLGPLPLENFEQVF